ncbi:MAG: hypothetical protein ACI9Q3_001019 [Maribacter sp.]|jgi:hypothetical protein
MVDTVKIRMHGANQHKDGIFSKIIAENTKTSMHLVPEHNELFMRLHNQKKEGFTSTQVLSHQKIINNEDHINDVVTNETTSQKNHFFTSNKIRFQSAEYIKERTANTYGKYNIRSSETEVVYLINYENGYIDFTFSIPKYLYGHNLAQFVPQYESKLFRKNSSTITQWDTQKNLLFPRLNKFLYAFLQDLFFSLELEYEPNMNYIELVRIDLCYNQYFDTKEIALGYLDEQKKLQKKSKIYSPETNTDYKTTIAWRTQNGNYFKIYHKGTEYINQKHGDFKKHQKINNEFLDYWYKETFKEQTKNISQNDAFAVYNKKKSPSFKMKSDYKRHQTQIKNLHKKSVTKENYFISDEELENMREVLIESEDLQPIDTLFLKNEMDKILRYEVSISGKYASYQFKNYVYRSKCPIHIEAKKVYKKVKRQLESPERFTIKIPTYHMTLYKMFHKWVNKANCLVLSKNPLLYSHCRRAGSDFDKLSNVYQITDAYRELGLGTILDKGSVGVFSKTHLNHLVDNFKKIINDFQLEELEPFDDLLKRVIRYNENVEQNKIIFNSKSLASLFFINPKYKIKFDKLSLKKNPDYIKRTDLLTESEQQNQGLRKVSYTDMLQFFNLMEDEKLTPFQIQEKLNLTKGQFYRRKKNLKLLGISERSVNMKIPIKPKLNFDTYYFKTSGHNYQQKFFLKQEHKQFS